MVLVSGLPEYVEDDEDIARFLTQSGHFKKGRVSASAFLPCTYGRETSTSRHGPVPLDELQQLGLAAAGGRKLYGAALIKACDVRAAQLEIAADEPPERHAVIRTWPWIEGDPQLQKAKQNECALALAAAAGEPLLFKGGEAWISV